MICRQPHGALAGIVLMDQFSRNIYRGTSKAFASDAKALAWAKQVVVSDTWHGKAA